MAVRLLKTLAKFLSLVVLMYSCKSSKPFYDDYYQQLKNFDPEISEEGIDCIIATFKTMERDFKCDLLPVFVDTVATCIFVHPEAEKVWVEGIFGKCGK